MSHSIRLAGAGLRFSAAHFATFRGECEPLHGHNYAVTAEISGDLSEDSWVLDFSDARDAVRGICRELDHRFLLQRDSRELEIVEKGGTWEIGFKHRLYVFPSADVIALPIDNSTSERLAEWLAGRLRDGLVKMGHENLRAISVGVEEAPGQAAWFSMSL
jgi:6-pyruvoyltetrahydropterin/6-carboxytetrahydropterin synthase